MRQMSRTGARLSDTRVDVQNGLANGIARPAAVGESSVELCECLCTAAGNGISYFCETSGAHIFLTYRIFTVPLCES